MVMNLMLTLLGLWIVFEVLSYFLVVTLRKRFQWLITPKDEIPEIKKEALDKFLKHGYDPELGWVRKPNTSKVEYGRYTVSERNHVNEINTGETMYHINNDGARLNTGHEDLPKTISCYGDSFAFCRQVNDGETWEWYLSELTKTNVLNWGVGNYGIDQALLRLKREYPKNPTNIVIMGVVPSTIVRNWSVWKHYHEYGNIFGFTPRFKIVDGKLILIKNIIDTEERFYRLEEYVGELRKRDCFYETKFKKEMIKFPYSISILKNARRNIPLISLVALSAIFEKLGLATHKFDDLAMDFIMKRNLELRYELFKTPEAVELLNEIIYEFVRYSKEQHFTPVLLWMPQKDDVLFVKNKEAYYSEFINEISTKLMVIDLTKKLINAPDLNELYSSDTTYGGHFSKFGNGFIADIVYDRLEEETT